MVAAAVAVSAAASVAGSAISSGAAGDAADAQSASAAAAMAEHRQQLAETQKLMQPYIDVGPRGLGGTQDLMGLNGNAAQQAAIEQIKSGSMFNELNKQGQNAILQNASATGGLRGGNVQAALAQFSPQLLQSLIDQRYQQLGNLSNMGQSAATNMGNFRMNQAAQVGQLYQDQGAAQAGGILGQAQALSNGINGIAGAFGTYAGATGGNSGFASGYQANSNGSNFNQMVRNAW